MAYPTPSLKVAQALDWNREQSDQTVRAGLSFAHRNLTASGSRRGAACIGAATLLSAIVDLALRGARPGGCSPHPLGPRASRMLC